MKEQGTGCREQGIEKSLEFRDQSLGVAMLAVILAIGMAQNACPMTIGVGAEGRFFSHRFSGWYGTSTKSMESDVRVGCYNDANPSPVTSVRLVIAPGAPKSIPSSKGRVGRRPG
jgi:hypothetical protein